jgi:hypothetical protein
LKGGLEVGCAARDHDDANRVTMIDLRHPVAGQ